ncbi:hypothetical protein CKAH01_03915 [Colletotrichum kahawae]|uniref:Uncharacterized protein n=1 Tax=Colletotrichum kahawae TaxID=34407 RepID=A0AAD9YNI4_COLKA|nr:hypothetical protein CKAH01_03915 [Colletotrichum kahawae]
MENTVHSIKSHEIDEVRRNLPAFSSAIASQLQKAKGEHSNPNTHPQALARWQGETIQDIGLAVDGVSYATDECLLAAAKSEPRRSTAHRITPPRIPLLRLASRLASQRNLLNLAIVRSHTNHQPAALYSAVSLNNDDGRQPNPGPVPAGSDDNTTAPPSQASPSPAIRISLCSMT